MEHAPAPPLTRAFPVPVSAVLSVSTKDSDSGLGGSSTDVLVFGTDIQSVTEFNKSKHRVIKTVTWKGIPGVLFVLYVVDHHILIEL